MSIDKKIYSALIACFLLILGVSILFAIPRVIDNYRMSVQDSLAADVAGRFNTYLYAAAAEMAETASSPALQSWEPGGRQPDLSQLKNGLSFFFNDFFLFNSSSEMIKSSTAYSARLKLPMDRRAALHKPGRPFPAVVTGPDGIKTIALCVPLFNQRGQQSGWLAGSLNTGVLRSGQTNFYLAGDKFLLYLCDGEDLIPLFEGQAGKAETEGLKAMKNPSAARRINIGNMSMVSADVGYPGWSVVAVMHRAQSNAVLAGENIKITLPLVLISLILVVLTALYMNNLLSPVIKLLSKLGSALNGDIRAGVDSLPKGLDAAIGSMKVLESVPIGIMVVDTGGFIRYFNSEAGEITGREPSSVTGKPMKDFFPNNYYNYTMESIVTQREYLGLRNIIMVDDFFKELLLDISPLYNNGTVTGAVATFQDVTPQRKMIEVKAAYTLARDLALQKDLDSTVEVIAKAASEMAETEYSAVFIADQDGSLLIKSSFGIPQKTVDKYNSRPYKTDGPEITDLYRNKAPLLHDDVRNKINLKPILIVPDVMSFYSFPIFCEDHLIGLINLYSLEKNKLSRDRIYLIRSL
ncbi:MAG: PAS domain S-box protein, partial [Bacillota bacterium]